VWVGKYLLSETEPLSSKKAIELAFAVEAADKNVQELQGTENTQKNKEGPVIK